MLKNQIWYRDKYVRLELIIYIVVWLVAFYIPISSQIIDLITKSQDYIDYDIVRKRFFQTLPFFIVFLLNNFVFNPLLLRRGWHFFYLLSVVAMLLGLWVYSGISTTLPHPPSVTQAHFENFITFHDIPNIIDLARTTTVIIGLFIIMANEIIKNYIMSIRKDQVMLQIRAEHTMTELNALKYQLDPHFLMNSLNSMQALVYIDQDRASHAIQLLSRLMRHLLYDSRGTTIALSKEIGFIKDLIELLELKMPANAHIITEFPIVDSSYKIPPRLFSPYIENAFKYGGGIDDAYIKVSISIEKNWLHFNCTNKISHPVADNPSGIGLKNASRRFDLLYGKHYNLTIANPDGHFIVDVVIPIYENKTFPPYISDRKR